MLTSNTVFCLLRSIAGGVRFDQPPRWLGSLEPIFQQISSRAADVGNLHRKQLGLQVEEGFQTYELPGLR